MIRSICKIIDDEFLKKESDSEDLEFMRIPRGYPYTLVGPTEHSDKVIYSTKPELVVRALSKLTVPLGFALIGRGGLPHELDREWISSLVGARQLIFLGDLDPVDLLIFAWLRDQLRPQHVSYCGISDGVLGRLQHTVPEICIIPNSASERDAISLLETAIPDLESILGPRCSLLVSQNYKIELEAVANTTASGEWLFEAVEGFS